MIIKLVFHYLHLMSILILILLSNKHMKQGNLVIYLKIVLQL